MAKKTIKKIEKEEVKEVVEEPIVEELPVKEVAKKLPTTPVHPLILAQEEEAAYLLKHAENLKTKKIIIHESGQLGYIDDEDNFVPK